MNIFCNPKADSALAGVSPALGDNQQADSVNQNSAHFGFCPEKKAAWHILQLECAVQLSGLHRCLLLFLLLTKLKNYSKTVSKQASENESSSDDEWCQSIILQAIKSTRLYQFLQLLAMSSAITPPMLMMF